MCQTSRFHFAETSVPASFDKHVQFSHLFLWLWSEHAQEVETRDNKDGEELKAIVK
jgi:hypothetical protein